MMNNEEFERKMEFFVNQQARFDANIQQLQESQRFTEQILDRTSQTLAQTAENLAHLTKITVDGFQFTLAAFDATRESFKEVNAKIDTLVDSQIRTDEMIRNVDSKLDRHLNEDDNST